MIKRVRLNLLTASLIPQRMEYDDITTCTILIGCTVSFCNTDFNILCIMCKCLVFPNIYMNRACMQRVMLFVVELYLQDLNNIVNAQCILYF